MKVDDFMTQAESYNKDADTLTGFFNLDEDILMNKCKNIVITAMEQDRKSDVILAIDAITDSKIEAIVATFCAIMKLEELREKPNAIDENSDAFKTAPFIGMALSMCSTQGLIDEKNIRKVADVFGKVFSSI